MKSKGLLAIFLILLLVSGSAVVSVVADSDDSDEEKRTLSTNGFYRMSVDPDTFVATIVVETEADTAEDAQRENARISSRVEKAVRFDHELTTSSYRIQPVYEWENCDSYISSRPCREKQVLVGYKTIHVYKFETSNLDDAGKGLDKFIDSGATRIDSIRFEISDELQNELNLQLLEEASRNAKEKAEAMASGFGVTLGNPLSINEGYSYRPVYYDYGYAKMAASSDMVESEPTSIVPGQIDLSASVSVTYEIF